MTTNTSKINYRNIILTLCIIFSIFHLWWIVGKYVPLNSDEAQYWLWSRHPDFSYYSKPPLIAYVNYLSTYFLGNTELGIRINPTLVGFILPLVHYQLAKTLFDDEKIAFWSSIVLFAMPHYHYTSMVFTTDTLVLLFWSLCMLYSWNAIKKDKWKYWILSGLTFGLGMISKYTMVLWGPLFIIAVSMINKKLLKSPRFYVALFIAFIICIPMLYWNITQKYVGAKHIFGLMGMYKSHSGIAHSVLKILEYLGGQVVCVSPLFIPVFYAVSRKWKSKTLGNDYQAINFLIIPLLITWSLFLVLSPQKNEINWTFFSFTSLPLLIGYSLVHFFSKNQRVITVSLCGIGILLFLVPSALDRMGIKSLIPPKIDLYHKQVGWDKLGENVSEIINIKQTGKDKVFIFSNSYHIASELAFYVDGQPQTYCINAGRRMNQFDLWPGIDQFSGKGYNAVYVSSEPLPGWFRESFEKTELVKTQKRVYRGEEVKPPFQIYILSGFKGEYVPSKHRGY